MVLKSGMELKIKGVPKSNPVRWSVDVGHSEDLLAIHIDFRFNYMGEERTIVINTLEKGRWQEEQREKNFPLEAGKEFEMTVSFTNDKFHINLHDGKMIDYPNLLGDKQYKCLAVYGDVMVSSLKVK